ncbi:T9SS type A sorting domain-containing protein [candidate division KSB1 bacterium]|nr:T9SS type A sorting domain-containing protein [candidate division KSB1 bacterium]
MRINVFFVTVYLIISSFLSAQDAAIEINLFVADDVGASHTLTCGLHPAATDTIDVSLGEAELPPFPPTGVFEARFVGHDINMPKLGEGTYTDFRQGDAATADTVTHELRYQVGEGSSVTIYWSLPPGITGRLTDLIGGVVVDEPMVNTDSLMVDNPGAVDRLIMRLYYLVIPAPPQLVSPTNESCDISPDTLLVWHRVRNAATYHIQLAKQTDFAEIVASDSGIVDTTYAVADLQAATTYYWRVQAQNTKGKSPWSDVWQFTVEPETSAAQKDQLGVHDFVVLQNYPNPFNPHTTIDYIVPYSGHVRIAVYNIEGRLIKTLVEENQNAGRYSVIWNGKNETGRNMPSGAFFVRLEAGGVVRMKKMILMR